LGGAVLAPGIASAADEYTVCGTTWAQEPMTIGAAGRTVHVPGFTIRQCRTQYGQFQDPKTAPGWIAPRVQPGVCDPSNLDAACFSIYVDRVPIAGYSNETVEITVEGVPLPPVDIDIPQHALADGGSTCVFSIGYHSAPTHNCAAYWDLGQ
jgi:hypothetical protein